MTERTIPVDVIGPIALDLTMNTGSIRVIVDTTLKQAHMVLTTEATSGLSADAIRDTTVSLNGQNLRVRVPDLAGGMSGTTTVSRGGYTMTFSGGNGVQIVNGNVHINGGGKVFINGREVTATGPAGDAVTPISAVVHLPAKSVAAISTHTANTVVTGVLARLEYDGTSGMLTADRVGDLEATVTSGSVIVGEVNGPLDISLTSGSVNVGAYSGHHARLNVTSGSVRMAATAQSSGRLSVNATSGSVRVTGAGHLNVRRRVTSGHVQIS